VDAEGLRAEGDGKAVLGVARVAVRRLAPACCSAYISALDAALEQEPPAWGTELYWTMYRAAAEEGQWLAISLIAAAGREGRRASSLWSLATRCVEGWEREALKRFAVNESNHVLLHMRTLDVAFPDVVDPAFRAQLDDLFPRYALELPLAADGDQVGEPPSLQDLVLFNLSALREVVLAVLRLPALRAHCPPERAGASDSLLGSLLQDELDHVASSAVVIERAAAAEGVRRLAQSFSRGLRLLERSTSEEAIDYTYHERFGNYP
jgi:hypothetical protein